MSLDALRFDNTFTTQLPGDPIADRRPRPVMGAAYSRVQPAPAPRPTLLAHAREVVDLLGLPADAPAGEEFVQVFAGNRVVAGMDPFAMNYGGHQFGVWAGQLGDGRAINLGEVLSATGRWMLQLKGSGLTPYSRHADGLAVVRSSVREFLCSEAMHHLGVPTTRALSVIATGRDVIRDMFYDGNPRPEPGAVVCRVAPSFTRFGNFEVFAWRRDRALLEQLVDYTIRTSFPHLGEPTPDARARWFEEVCTRTAHLIVEWLRVGFVHGVMNTDNMSILGLTIDYGPYGWLEDFDPDWTPNTTDASHHRYAFGAQPGIALWNLAALARSVSGIVDAAALEASLKSFQSAFTTGWQTMMASKLGLPAFDDDLVDDLENMLRAIETDMTLFYRHLARVDDPAKAADVLEEAYYRPEQVTPEYRSRLASWVERWLAHGPDRARMNAVNPKYVLRNYLAQLAIDPAEKGDGSKTLELLDVLRRPYDEQPGREEYARRRPEWARHRAGCSMLSCSS
jgi:uncharacterized protein YdiU (UPF0061 family)